MRTAKRSKAAKPEDAPVCIRCAHAIFLDPKKEICWKTGGLFCKKLKEVVGKYEPCRLKKPAKKVKK